MGLTRFGDFSRIFNTRAAIYLGSTSVTLTTATSFGKAPGTKTILRLK